MRINAAPGAVMEQKEAGIAKVWPRVTIVIPFYNCAYIEQAIESALGQTYPNLNVIVVNDGSTRHAEKIKPYLPYIRYIEQANRGTASALNTGARSATGGYFAWLSSDDRYEPTRVEEQIRFMLERNASVCYGNYVHIDEMSQVISGPLGIMLPTRRAFIEQLASGCFINGCTVMLKVDVINQAGWFNERLKFTQDYDMWLRLARFYLFHYFDKPLVQYRIHGSMGSTRYADDIRKEVQRVRWTHAPILRQFLRSTSMDIV